MLGWRAAQDAPGAPGAGGAGSEGERDGGTPGTRINVFDMGLADHWPDIGVLPVAQEAEGGIAIRWGLRPGVAARRLSVQIQPHRVRIGFRGCRPALDWIVDPAISRVDADASGWTVCDGILEVELEMLPP